MVKGMLFYEYMRTITDGISHILASSTVYIKIYNVYSDLLRITGKVVIEYLHPNAIIWDK